MATSSIFENFIVDDQESIKILFDALTKDKTDEPHSSKPVKTLRGKELSDWLDRVWPTK